MSANVEEDYSESSYAVTEDSNPENSYNYTEEWNDLPPNESNDNTTIYVNYSDEEQFYEDIASIDVTASDGWFFRSLCRM
jgi:hypothetical protein